MNRNEQEYYANIDNIARALDRIANALENQNQFVVNTIKGQKTQDEQIAHNVKHAFTGIDGTQVDEAIELDIQHDYLHQLLKNFLKYVLLLYQNNNHIMNVQI